jgi:hypothetical protein
MISFNSTLGEILSQNNITITNVQSFISKEIASIYPHTFVDSYFAYCQITKIKVENNYQLKKYIDEEIFSKYSRNYKHGVIFLLKHSKKTTQFYLCFTSFTDEQITRIVKLKAFL